MESFFIIKSIERYFINPRRIVGFYQQGNIVLKVTRIQMFPDSDMPINRGEIKIQESLNQAGHLPNNGSL